jgi:2-dehydropantoate 2-reductase
MKILVYGAGVQGSVYAARLIRAGHDVSVLARGVRLKQIRDHGLVLRELTLGVEISTPAHVVERLDAEDRYDLVIVSVRRDQLQVVLPELAANRHVPTFLFLLNNAAGFDHISHLLGRSRVLAGFPTVGGSRLDHVIHYVLISQQPTTVGELDGALTERLKTIRHVLQQAGFPVAISGNIDAWLKTHVVFIIAIAGALCLAGGDSLQLARTPDLLSLMVSGVREGFRELRAQSIPVIPLKLRALFLWFPPFVPVMYWKRYLGSERGELTIARHVRAAPDEMKELVNEWRDLQGRHPAKTPALDRLCSAISRPRKVGQAVDVSLDNQSLLF